MQRITFFAADRETLSEMHVLRGFVETTKLMDTDVRECTTSPTRLHSVMEGVDVALIAIVGENRELALKMLSEMPSEVPTVLLLDAEGFHTWNAIRTEMASPRVFFAVLAGKPSLFPQPTHLRHYGIEGVHVTDPLPWLTPLHQYVAQDVIAAIRRRRWSRTQKPATEPATGIAAF